MFETSPDANAPLTEIQIRFLVRFCILIREVCGLPSADYAASKSSALILFQGLELARDEDEAIRQMRQNPTGAQSLLCAIILHATPRGAPISLPQIAAAKKEDAKWEKEGLRDTAMWMLFRNAIAALD